MAFLCDEGELSGRNVWTYVDVQPDELAAGRTTSTNGSIGSVERTPYTSLSHTMRMDASGHLRSPGA